MRVAVHRNCVRNLAYGSHQFGSLAETFRACAAELESRTTPHSMTDRNSVAENDITDFEE
jgi:hypothetical protein